MNSEAWRNVQKWNPKSVVKGDKEACRRNEGGEAEGKEKDEEEKEEEEERAKGESFNLRKKC